MTFETRRWSRRHVRYQGSDSSRRKYWIPKYMARLFTSRYTRRTEQFLWSGAETTQTGGRRDAPPSTLERSSHSGLALINPSSETQ